MATNNNITNFTAADIERYHKGLLSKKEMHDLEKAALDDPFLADALEGYAVAGHSAQADLAELGTRLSEKVEGAKVIAIAGDRKKPIPWLRIAAFVIVIAGAAFLANQFVFNSNKKGSIAKVEEKKTGDTRSTDSAVAATGTTTDGIKSQPVSAGKDQQTVKGTVTPGQERFAEISSKNNTDDLAKTENPAGNTKPVTVTTTPATDRNPPAVAGAGAEDKLKVNNELNKTAGKEKSKEDLAVEKKLRDTDADAVKDQFDKERALPQKKNDAVTAKPRAANEETVASGQFNQQSNTFRGRVTDANNIGIPFANVTNAQDNNAGTYTNAQGYFNLTYPDSVLSVQVRSIGFENSNVQLRNNVPTNQVVLQDDRKSLSEVVISNQKPNAAARNRDANMKLEEPEPADGWENYDAYLANNLNAPEEIKTKQTSGQVQVSFEVNKNGEPVAIKIEKSLCGKCDQEAIRLIKDGPKWKRNANKKGRTTVTINF